MDPTPLWQATKTTYPLPRAVDPAVGVSFKPTGAAKSPAFKKNKAKMSSSHKHREEGILRRPRTRRPPSWCASPRPLPTWHPPHRRRVCGRVPRAPLPVRYPFRVWWKLPNSIVPWKPGPPRGGMKFTVRWIPPVLHNTHKHSYGGRHPCACFRVVRTYVCSPMLTDGPTQSQKSPDSNRPESSLCHMWAHWIL